MCAHPSSGTLSVSLTPLDHPSKGMTPQRLTKDTHNSMSTRRRRAAGVILSSSKASIDKSCPVPPSSTPP